MAYLSLALRLLIGSVCLVAALGKLSSPQAIRGFRRTLAEIGAPRRLVPPAAAAIILAELSVVGLAPWPSTGVIGMLLGTALLGAFTIGVARAVREGTTASCRCFGMRSGRLSRLHIVRNAVLTAAAATALILAAAVPRPAQHPAGVALAVAAAALGTLVVVAWEDLAALVWRQPAARPSPP